MFEKRKKRKRDATAYIDKVISQNPPGSTVARGARKKAIRQAARWSRKTEKKYRA